MDAFNLAASGRTSASAVLKAMQILQAEDADADAVFFSFEASILDERMAANPLERLESMHQAILSECEMGKDGKWHYYGKEKRK